MAQPRVDSSRFPLVIFEYMTAMTVPEVDLFFVELEGLYKRGKLAAVGLADNLTGTEARARAHFTQKMDALTMKYPRRVVCEAVVVSHFFPRGMVTTYLWMKRDKSYPTKVFATLPEAIAWAEKTLHDAGVAVPPLV